MGCEHVVELVDDDHAHAGGAQSLDERVLPAGQVVAAEGCQADRAEQRAHDRPYIRTRRHLHDQHGLARRGRFGRRTEQVAAEFLRDHRLAVVGRSDDQQVGHAQPPGVLEQLVQPVERLHRPRVGDPSVRADARDPFDVMADGRWRSPRLYHSSTS